KTLFRIVGAYSSLRLETNGPQNKAAVVPRNGGHIAEAVRAGCHILVFVARDWPQFPAFQFVPVSERKNWIHIIIRHHVRLSRLAVKRKHDEENIVAKQPVLQVAIKGPDRRV